METDEEKRQRHHLSSVSMLHAASIALGAIKEMVGNSRAEVVGDNPDAAAEFDNLVKVIEVLDGQLWGAQDSIDRIYD